MVKVRVPATSANVGVGFDCLGIALDLYTHFEFSEVDGFSITGCDESFQTKDNLVYTSFLKALSYLKKDIRGVHIHVDSNVPMSRGLGSSATCVVGGVVGAYALTKTPINKQDILNICTEIEGHPDNVAPAIFGGLNASCVVDDAVLNVQYDIDKRFRFLALIPNFETKTSDARKALPDTLDFHTAVSNSSKLSVVLKAFETFDVSILKHAMKDEVHELYRKQIIYEYEEVKALCEKIGNICFYISGSGSTLMNVVDDAYQSTLLKKELNQLNYIWEVKLLKVDFEGVVVC